MYFYSLFCTERGFLYVEFDLPKCSENIQHPWPVLGRSTIFSGMHELNTIITTKNQFPETYCRMGIFDGIQNFISIKHNYTLLWDQLGKGRVMSLQFTCR